MSGYAVVKETLVEAGSLPSLWSAQGAELHALIWALQLPKGKMSIYTDFRCAFTTLHVHGALYKGRGLLMASGKDIENKEKTLTLLFAVWEPEEVALMHCQGHQKEDTPPQAWGNRLADKAAKYAAKEFGDAGGGLVRTFVLSKMLELTLTLSQYTSWPKTSWQKQKRPPKMKKVGRNRQMAGHWYPRQWSPHWCLRSTRQPTQDMTK